MGGHGKPIHVGDWGMLAVEAQDFERGTILQTFLSLFPGASFLSKRQSSSQIFRLSAEGNDR